MTEVGGSATGANHLSIATDSTATAAEFKRHLTEKLVEIATLMDEANAAGFEVVFGMGKDFAKRNCIAHLKLVKEF